MSGLVQSMLDIEESARSAERAAVVAYLRRRATEADSFSARCMLESEASEIEEGSHQK